MRRLLRNPILLREMEIRAGRDEGYRLFNYSGPGLFLLLLGSPAVFGMLIGDVITVKDGGSSVLWPPAMFLVTAWLLVIYFSHAAARFCAGSVAIDRERGTLDALRMLPRSTADLFAGKYLAAIAPLLLEAVAAIPLLGLYSLLGSVRLGSVLAVGLLNLGVIVFFGLWGMFWSVRAREVITALSRAFGTVLACNVLPLAAAFVLLFLRAGSEGGMATLFTFSPLYLVGGLTVPAQETATLWALHAPDVMALAAVLLGSSLMLYRRTMRALAGR